MKMKLLLHYNLLKDSKKIKLEVRSKISPVQGKIMHLKQELEQERHKRTELEYKLQQHMKEKQPDNSQVHGELNR